MARPNSTEGSICPWNGPMSASAVDALGFQRIGAFSLCHEWLDKCWLGPSRLACPPNGSPGTAYRAMTGGCECGWKSSPKPMCWQCRARSMSGWTGSSDGRNNRWPLVAPTSMIKEKPQRLHSLCEVFNGLQSIAQQERHGGCHPTTCQCGKPSAISSNHA